MKYVSVQVPEAEASSLTVLTEEAGMRNDDVVRRVHSFDGALTAQILIPLSGAVVAVLRTWMKARQESRSDYRIVADGIELSGYTAAEAEKVLRRLLGASDDAAEDGD